MTSTLVPRGVLAALAGAAFAMAAATGPSSAFTLSAPSLAAPVAAASVEPVWWDRWGRWRPNRPWGWGPRPYYGYYGAPAPYYGVYGAPAPVRRCWIGPWGGVRCRWA